jgi:hypothetical protein
VPKSTGVSILSPAGDRLDLVQKKDKERTLFNLVLRDSGSTRPLLS